MMFKKNSRFLIVEDSSVVREIIRQALEQMDYKPADEAENGKLGWEKILLSVEENKPYDLVFSDINMPEIDGLKLLEMVRGNPSTSQMPIVVVTTESEKQIVLKAVMSGVSGYMVKPFGVENVKTKMQEVYARLNSSDTTG
ncbi:MAG: hypothetical protein A2Z20_09455 [Bdellovibrionales bacterium RBG_16_40_8]|nr:MAG: hypothetical protein A2Z20_09455 [Bdellovibrionales bacterium RBG_16_40_8]